MQFRCWWEPFSCHFTQIIMKWVQIRQVFFNFFIFIPGSFNHMAVSQVRFVLVLVFLIWNLRGIGDILWQGIRELGPDLFPHTHREAGQMHSESLSWSYWSSELQPTWADQKLNVTETWICMNEYSNAHKQKNLSKVQKQCSCKYRI